MNEPDRSPLGSTFTLTMRALHGLPDVTPTKATTVRSMTPIKDEPQTFIVQTLRHKERGDTVFVEYLGPEGSMRIALPPAVADCIARQRDALTTKVRKRLGREQAAARKAQGLPPAFLKTGTGE